MAALPLSGCPLKRLEIHGGPTHSTYDAANSDSSLTATLEAQRSTNGNSSNMLLQSHLGLKRIFSIQLIDLNVIPMNEREVIKIHEPSLRISIRIHRIQQIIVIYFERKQDFSHTKSLLKRIGFRVEDGIPSTLHSPDTTKTPGASSSHNLGPRLSSLTPLGNRSQCLSQSQFSFTSMLNSDVPLAQLLPPSTNDEYIRQPSPYYISQQSRRQTDPVKTYTSHTTPPHIHFSQPKNTHQPRISSPLRYAVPVNDQSEATNLPMPNSQPTFLTDRADIPSLSSHWFISEPNSLSNHSQLSEISVTSYNTSPGYQIGPASSQDSITSVESSSQATDATDDDLSLQLGQDFRKLLPRARSLPFLKGRDHKAVKSKSRTKQNQLHGNSQGKGTIVKNADVHQKEQIQVTDSNNVDSQLALQPTSPQSKASQASDQLTCHSFFETAKLSAMLITDPTLLERANKATSKLFDQYKEDLNRGYNATSFAEFYLEQIHAVRTEFWYNELKQIDGSGNGSEILYRT